MNERESIPESSPELTTEDVRALASQVLRRPGEIIELTNPEEQRTDLPMPHAFVTMLDEPHVKKLNELNNSLPRDYLAQLSAVKIQYVEQRIDENEAGVLLDPLVVVSAYEKEVISEEFPYGGPDQTSEYHLSLTNASAHNMVNIVVSNAGKGEPIVRVGRKRPLGDSDILLLRAMIIRD